MSKFSDWTKTKLDKRFGIEELRTLPALDNWLNSAADITDIERIVLNEYQELLRDNADSWNEQELALNFIGPIFGLVKYGHSRKFNFFAERSFSGTVDGEEMTGNPDGTIAKGFREPETPYFCFHEYKKDIDYSGDPAGQCLAPMLVAQTMNDENKPIFGCYIVSRTWRFIVLQNKKYAISDSYIATQADIYDIFRILKALKNYVTKDLGLE